MLLHFTKMHSLGNDFMIVDNVTQSVWLTPLKIKRLADRRLGIGFDQLLLVEPPTAPDMDFRYRIFNADGSEAEQCGNGARCFACFVRDKQLIGRDLIRVQTAGNNIVLNIHGHQVTVAMGRPRLNPAAIPFNAERPATTYPLEVAGQTLSIAAVSLGNPHAILTVADLQKTPIANWGPAIAQHVDFPRQCNAGFMQVMSRTAIHLRVYERGIGETPACGSGACAAVIAGVMQGLLNDTVDVNMPGGCLTIRWPGQGHSVMMTGPATRVFTGHIRL